MPSSQEHTETKSAKIFAVTEGSKSEESTARKAGWWERHTSVATRLAIAILLVSIVSLVGFLVVAVVGSGSDGEDLLHERLTTIAGDRSAELSSYVNRVEAQLQALGVSRMIIDGVQEFSAAYDELAELDLDDLVEERADLSAYYLDEFVPTLQEIRGGPVDLAEVSDGLKSAAVYLQATYIARNPLETGEKRMLGDGMDGSAWTEIHKQLHPILRADADRLGFSNLYLIEPETRSIVYSSNKEIDFGTSLDSGPHSGTVLAGLVVNTIASGEPGTVIGADFTSYDPAFDEPTAFAATPLFDGDRLVGVLAVSLSNEIIDEIMTRDWRSGQLGDTGEVYLAGDDARMRSNARAFIEEPALYLERVDELGAATSQEQHQMEALGTTVLFQDVDGTAVRSALQGKKGLISGTSYLGEEVYTAYQPLDGTAFSWVILAEQQRAEVDLAVNTYVGDNLALITVLIVVLTFFAVAWASSFVRPLRAISAALQEISEGSDDTMVPSRGAQEFRVLSGHLNTMVGNLSGRKHDVLEALEKKVGILRTLLPGTIADAIVDGDRRLVETIPQSSVVVVVVDGLAELFRTSDAEANRTLMNAIVDDADRVAETNGLERIKVMGDTYYAVCGTGAPYLDHAPRAARFAQQVRDSVRRIADDDSLDLDVTAGIQSGPITVGLIGDSHLIYDLWGDTVDQAYALARAGRGGEILVTDTVRDRLPDGEDLVPFNSGETSAWALNSSEETDEVGL